MATPNKSVFANKRTPNEERMYCHKAAIRIMQLLEPARKLSVSRLNMLKSAQLEEIGKAARELYDVLEKSGLNRQ